MRFCLPLLFLLTSPVEAGILNLLVENDVTSGTDRHYTSGVMVNYVSAVDEGPEYLEKLGIALPGIEEGDQMHVAVSFGHEIYTPTDISDPALIEDDRPYAGYAYLGAGFIIENSHEVETWRLSLGLVGPGARAEVIQNNLHRKVGSEEAAGWDHQLKNEWVVALAYEKKWLSPPSERTRIDTWRADLIPHVSASVGASGSYVGAGATIRFGRGLAYDYGPPRVRPSLPTSQFYDNPAAASFYVFAGIDARYVAHNIFLDGNNHRDSHAVDREDFVADLQAGFVWNTRRFRVAYNWVLRTREFIQQDERDLFSSLSISIPI